MTARARTVGIGVLAVLLAGGLLVLGKLLAVSSPLPQPDAIIVLGSHEWERFPVAARVARLNPRAVVLLTTPVWVTEKNCYMCNQRVELLVRSGVQRGRIVVLAPRVRNTHDEAAAAYSFAATRGIRSLLIVTSPYHGRRALATFRDAFMTAPVRVGLESSFRESGAAPGSWWMHAYDRWYVAYESAALVMYAARYHVSPFLN